MNAPLTLLTTLAVALILGSGLAQAQVGTEVGTEVEAEVELDYRFTAVFTHLGQVIAKPQMDLESGETAAGHYDVPDGASYRIAAKVEPAGNGDVHLSFQFTSGNIDIQPNLLVPLGEPYSTTKGKVAIQLLVEPLEGEAGE